MCEPDLARSFGAAYQRRKLGRRCADREHLSRRHQAGARALAALFGGTVGKDTVSRAWRRVKSDWDVWNTRSLAEDPIVRLILDGAVGSRSLGYSGRIDSYATRFTFFTSDPWASSAFW